MYDTSGSIGGMLYTGCYIVNTPDLIIFVWQNIAHTLEISAMERGKTCHIVTTTCLVYEED